MSLLAILAAAVPLIPSALVFALPLVLLYLAGRNARRDAAPVFLPVYARPARRRRVRSDRSR